MISKLTLALFFCVSLLLVGCSKPNPMVGKWSLEIAESAKKNLPPGMSMPKVSAEFKADNTFTLHAEFMEKTSNSEGTYKVEGNNVTMTLTKVDGKPPTDNASQTITLSDDGKSFDPPNGNGMGKMVKQ